MTSRAAAAGESVLSVGFDLRPADASMCQHVWGTETQTKRNAQFIAAETQT